MKTAILLTIIALSLSSCAGFRADFKQGFEQSYKASRESYKFKRLTSPGATVKQFCQVYFPREVEECIAEPERSARLVEKVLARRDN